MTLRDQFQGQLKAAMKGGDPARTSTLRMILARVKDLDIAARPKGVDAIPDDDVRAALRGMVKSRRESVELYRKGNRPDLVDKEEAEIAVIESFLPRQLGSAETEQAVADVIADIGATSVKDMGRVMAALKERHAASVDLAKAGQLVRARLGG